MKGNRLLRWLFPPIERRADRRIMFDYFKHVLVMYYWCILIALIIWWIATGCNLSTAVYRWD